MKQEVIQKLSTLVAAAFGLVAALAWNDTIKAIFAKVFEEPNTVPAMLIYSTVVTVIAVVATIHIGKVTEKAKEINALSMDKISKINNIIKSNLKKK